MRYRVNLIIIAAILFNSIIFAGNITISLSGVDPLTIQVKGNTVNEEAGNINVYLYYRDDAITDLAIGNVNASQLETTFGWGTGFRTQSIETGSWNKGGNTYTRRLFYGNVDLLVQDDLWTTSGINAIVCDFTAVGPGSHAYIEADVGGMADYSGTPHTVSYSNQEASLPVEMSLMEAESTTDGVKLTWATASEVNSSGYHIWRAESEDGNYEKITNVMIASQGNTSTGAEYQYVDHKIEESGTLYYKIQQLDADGTSEFFEVLQVEALYIPDSFDLSSNYPNPFNPMTHFTYDVPEISDVKIIVYSLLGQKVRTLFNEEQVPGRHTEVWDGTDERGQKLSSGVYFLRMQAGTFTQMRKMTLLR